MYAANSDGFIDLFAFCLLSRKRLADSLEDNLDGVCFRNSLTIYLKKEGIETNENSTAK